MSASTTKDPVLWEPDGNPPDCCAGDTFLSASFLYKSIAAQKTKCGTAPIKGLTNGDEGHPVYGQPEDGPHKFYLVVTETASGHCEAGEDCEGYNGGDDPEHDTSSGTLTHTTEPRCRRPYYQVCLVTDDGELHDNCGNWFYVNWNYNWTETMFQVIASEGEPPPRYCKVLGSTTYTLTLSEEFTTDLLKTIIEELLGVCTWADIPWREDRTGVFKFNVARERECAVGTIYDTQIWPDSAYRWLQKDESQLSRRKLHYKVSVSISDPLAELDSSYRVRWREMFLPGVEEDQDPVPRFTDKEFTGTPSEEDGNFESEEYSVEPPEENGNIVQVGLPAKGTVTAEIEVKGWELTKRGYLEYQPTGDKPRVYKRETASGSFPGCPVQNLPAKTYNGFQRYTDQSFEVEYPGGSYNESESDDPTGNNQNTFNQAVKDSGQYSPDFPHGGPFEYRLAVKEITPTQRTFEKQITCGTRTVKDTLRFQLQEEYTTEQLRSRVEAEYNKNWDDQELKHLWVVEVDEFNVYALEEALLFQSEDEAYYAKQQLRYKLTFTIPWSFATDKDFTFKWTVFTERFDTGEISRSEQSKTVTFEDGNTLVREDDWREIPAPTFPGRIWLGAFEGPEHPLFYEQYPKIERA